MKKILHYYSLTPEWQIPFAKQLDTSVEDDKIIVFPEKFGHGHSYFTEVTAGISVYFVDISIHQAIKLCRQKSEHELYIFHFDLSEHINLIKIDNEDYQIGSYDKLDLAIIDNQIESSYKPTLNERTFALRILVDKKLLNDFIEKYKHKIESSGKIQKKDAFYHYGNIDSNSILLLKSLKTKSIRDVSFAPYIKGVSLKLLGNFFNRFYDSENKKNILTEAENDAIDKTKNFLLSNLHSPFPSVTFLATMAGMSESKYKMAFKKCNDTTPNNFFIHEKMKLAQQILQSGEYSSITEVIYELNYSKLSYFSSKYFEIIGKKPMEDFIKKPHHKK
ncbi:helix-turn-helix domain-containing protein [Flavobacterium sp. P21]|uniref:helix-turn-helix domain-containing protein n=1 Tax=Flavobacterium sp. P21 TaxID=3423948 RepID=UPI003D664046